MAEFLRTFIDGSAFFGITLTLITYAAGILIQRKTGSKILNPLLVSIVLTIAFLVIFGIPYEDYAKGVDVLNLFTTPATAVLALSVYRNRRIIASNLLPVFVGVICGSLTSILFISGACRLLSIDGQITNSLISKSITTPLAVSVTESLGGIGSITVIATIITGITGYVLAEPLSRLFRFRDPLVQGLAIGSASHALGTSRALEIGPVQGSLSSVSLALSGITTVILCLLIF